MARSDPSPSGSSDNLKCVICGKIAKKGVRKKYRVSEKQRANDLRAAAECLMDDVYTRVCDLKTASSIFAADVYYHRACFPEYMNKYKQAQSTSQDTIPPAPGKREIFKRYTGLIKDTIAKGRGLSLSDIRDMINDDNDTSDFRNNEVKMFLSEEFADEIQFCTAERQNQSQFVFSSSVGV